MTVEPPVPNLEECHHCGALVPTGAFCGNCGAHLSDPSGGSRLGAYAAAPHEHVTRIAVVSTLFPHLPHRHAHVFRESLLVGVLVVLLLGALRLYAPALLVAAVLLPVLYLIYLYEVEVYQGEPWTVIAATLVTGAALGFVYTFVVGRIISATLSGTHQGPFITGVLLPVIAQLLMLAGPLLLISRQHFSEVLDGLTFGVSSALGFTLAAVITGYWHVLTAPLQSANAIAAEDIAGVVRAAILAALVNASATGMITAALWQRRYRRAAGRHASPLRALPAIVAVAFGAQIALGLISYYVGSLLLLVVLWAIAAALLLVWLRVLLHHALLDESAEHLIGEASPCPECHRLVPTMNFCPACGVARSAGPKRGRAPLASPSS